MKRILIIGGAVFAILAWIIWKNACSVPRTVGFIRIGPQLNPVLGPIFMFEVTNQLSYTVECQLLRLESEAKEGWRVATNFPLTTASGWRIVGLLIDQTQSTMLTVPVQSTGNRWRAVFRYRRFPKPRGIEDVARYYAGQDPPWFTNVSDTVAN